MKKRTLLILALVALSLPTFAATEMQPTGWAWINDDGDAATATFAADQDLTPITVTTDGVIRLRVRFDNMTDNGRTTTGLTYFTELPATNIKGDNAMLINLAPDAFFDWASSAFVTDGTPVETRDITYNSVSTGDFQATFSPGIFVSSAQPFVVPTKQYSEIEYCIKPTGNIVDGTYYFLPGGTEVILYPEASNLETFPTLTYGTGIPDAVKTAKSSDVSVATSEGSITLSSLSNGTVKVAIVNALGQTVKTVSAETADGQLTIATNGLAQGMYMVQINGVTGKKVIIK